MRSSFIACIGFIAVATALAAPGYRLGRGGNSGNALRLAIRDDMTQRMDQLSRIDQLESFAQAVTQTEPIAAPHTGEDAALHLRRACGSTTCHLLPKQTPKIEADGKGVDQCTWCEVKKHVCHAFKLDHDLDWHQNWGATE